MAALIRLLIFGKVRAENFAISVRKTNFRVLKYDRILNRIRNTSRAPLLRVIFAINHVYLVNQIKSSECVINDDKIALFFRALLIIIALDEIKMECVLTSCFGTCRSTLLSASRSRSGKRTG